MDPPQPSSGSELVSSLHCRLFRSQPSLQQAAHLTSATRNPEYQLSTPQTTVPTPTLFRFPNARRLRGRPRCWATRTSGSLGYPRTVPHRTTTRWCNSGCSRSTTLIRMSARTAHRSASPTSTSIRRSPASWVTVPLECPPRMQFMRPIAQTVSWFPSRLRFVMNFIQ